MPFARILLALVTGILLQWNIQFRFCWLLPAFIAGLCLLLAYFFLPLRLKFRFGLFCGLLVLAQTVLLGAMLVWMTEPRNKQTWIGNAAIEQACAELELEESLTEKPNSFKAIASIKAIYQGHRRIPARGKVIVYFKKDLPLKRPAIGSLLIAVRPLQEVKSTGNPGSFDYKRYCYFQGISHQVYLAPEDYILLPAATVYPFKNFIFSCRQWVLRTIRKFIPGEKEAGLAEALLIGYKDDLDKDLVQSYSNTGVVHVIAISGLHLGLIYGLLLVLTRPLRSRLLWLRLVIIIAGLWLFSILAGAQPSVLRSALMFTFLAGGEVLRRRSGIYNSLALSAFLLLCYNPFWLWDIGFQLSYSAVLSILIFFRPVYNWWVFPGWLPDQLWKLSAVTLSAQLLTTPVSCFHFHQFPLMFLVTNLVAVPLSSAILFGELLLCALHFVQPVAKLTGWLLHWLIFLMNAFIERIGRLPFAVWEGLYLSAVQAVLLTAFILCLSAWFMAKHRVLLWMGLLSALSFMALRAQSFRDTGRQKKIIIYNITKHRTIEFLAGRKAYYAGDKTPLRDRQLWSFHIKSSRVLHRINRQKICLPGREFIFCNRRLIIVDTALQFLPVAKKIRADILLLSRNPSVKITSLSAVMDIRQLVIDGSVPPWRAANWKKECDSLRIPCYNIAEKGAFVMKL